MQKNIDTKSWYLQFWPWLVIGLPAICVVAGILTIQFAIRSADDMVVDNYYKDGKAINQRLEQDQRAAELSLLAEVSFNFDSGQLNLSLSGDDQPDALVLNLFHPMEADGDQFIDLKSLGYGNYRGELTKRLEYRYLLRLMPALTLNEGEDERLAPWRLNGEIDFARSQGTVLVSSQP